MPGLVPSLPPLRKAVPCLPMAFYPTCRASSVHWRVPEAPPPATKPPCSNFSHLLPRRLSSHMPTRDGGDQISQTAGPRIWSSASHPSTCPQRRPLSPPLCSIILTVLVLPPRANHQSRRACLDGSALADGFSSATPRISAAASPHKPSGAVCISPPSACSQGLPAKPVHLSLSGEKDMAVLLRSGVAWDMPVQRRCETYTLIPRGRLGSRAGEAEPPSLVLSVTM